MTRLFLLSEPRIEKSSAVRRLSGISLGILRELAAAGREGLSRPALSRAMWPIAGSERRAARLSQRLYWIRENIDRDLVCTLGRGRVGIVAQRIYIDFMSIKASWLATGALTVGQADSLRTGLEGHGRETGPLWRRVLRKTLESAQMVPNESGAIGNDVLTGPVRPVSEVQLQRLKKLMNTGGSAPCCAPEVERDMWRELVSEGLLVVNPSVVPFLKPFQGSNGPQPEIERTDQLARARCRGRRGSPLPKIGRTAPHLGGDVRRVMNKARQHFVEADVAGVRRVLREAFALRFTPGRSREELANLHLLEAILLMQGLDDIAEEAIHAALTRAEDLGSATLAYAARNWQILLMEFLGRLETNEGLRTLAAVNDLLSAVPYGRQASALNLASWKISVGEPEAAVQALDGLEGPHPEQPDPWFYEKLISTRAEALLGSHRLEEALAEWTRILPADPMATPLGPSTVANLAYCRARLGHRTRAQGLLTTLAGIPGDGFGPSSYHLLRARLEASDHGVRGDLWRKAFQTEDGAPFQGSFTARIRFLELRERYRTSPPSEGEERDLRDLAAELGERRLRLGEWLKRAVGENVIARPSETLAAALPPRGPRR